MALMGRPGWRLVVACIAAFVLVFGAVVAVRAVTARNAGPRGKAPGAYPAASSANGALKVSPSLLAGVQAGAPVGSVAFSPGGRILAARETGGLVELRDASTGSLLGVLDPGTGENLASPDGATLAFSPDGKFLAVAVSTRTGSSSQIDLFDVAARRLTATLPLPLPGVYSVAYSPGGETVAVADGMLLVLWDVKDRTFVKVQAGHMTYTVYNPTNRTYVKMHDGQMSLTGDARYVSYSANGRFLALANNLGLVQLWDVGAERFISRVTVYPAHGTPVPAVSSISVSPDGGTVAVAGSLQGSSQGLGSGQQYSTRAVWLWHPATGKIATLLRNTNPSGAQGQVYSVAFSPAGLLATADSLGQVTLWDTASGQADATFTPRAAAGALAFGPGGKELATASLSGAPGETGASSIDLWNVYAARG